MRSFLVLVSTIGDRLCVYGLCANSGKDHPSVAANVLSERMALFSGRSRSSRRGAKRKAVTKQPWTVSLIRVADRYQSRIPWSTEKQVLFHAGLGMKKIKLDFENDEHDVLDDVLDNVWRQRRWWWVQRLSKVKGIRRIQDVSGCKELKPLNWSWTAKNHNRNFTCNQYRRTCPQLASFRRTNRKLKWSALSVINTYWWKT